MKKLFALLIVVVFLPVSAFAFDKEIDYYGGYAHIEIRKDNTPVMYMIYLAEDFSCYYLAQSFNRNNGDIGRCYVGTWGYTADGDVIAKIGDNTQITFKITSLGAIVDRETMQVYEYFSGLFH